MKKIYLDVCTLCRPFDDQNVMRLRLETDAYYLILNNIQKKQYEMIVSDVHFHEIESIEDIREKFQVLQLLTFYGVHAKIEIKTAIERTHELIRKKFGIADAAHVAYAEQSADYLITC